MTDDAGIATPPLPGLFARFAGVITAPTATFEKIVKTPKVGGMLGLVVVLMGFLQGGFLMTQRGQQAFMDMMTQRGMPEQSLAGFQKVLPYMGWITMAQSIIFVPLVAVVFAGVFYVIFNVIMGGTATFKQVMAVITHAMVISVLGLLFALPITYMRGTMSSVGPANLAVLVPMLEENSFLVKFLGSVDLFLVWGIIVEGIGLGTLYRRSSTRVAGTLLVFYLVVVAVIAYFTSR